MSKQLNIRLDKLHQILLEETVEKIGTNNTDVVKKALHSFSRDVLGRDRVMEIIEKYYTEDY